MVLSARSTQTPFIVTRKEIISRVVKEFDFNNESIFYDLGSGDGRMLYAVKKSNKCITTIGIEKEWFPMLLARMRYKTSSLQFLYGEVSQFNLSDATHIYCYLLPKPLILIEKQILSQCKTGTKIICCDFHLPSLKPINQIDIHQDKFKLGKKIFVYVL